MGIGKVEIYNRALNLLGLAPVSSVSADNERTRVLNITYDMVLDELLMEEPWGFSKKRAKLALLSNSDVSQFKYEYQYPADCLKLVEISSETDIMIRNYQQSKKEWEVIGDVIASDTKDLYAEYIHIPQDISKWFAYFKTCLAYKLAIESCYSLINSNAREEYLSQKYETMILPRAISLDAQQENPVEELNILTATGDNVRGYY